jgi:hypothetical protein
MNQTQTQDEDVGPRSVLEAYYETFAEAETTAEDLSHSETADPFERGIETVETELLERDLDASETAEKSRLDDGTIEEVVNGEDTALVEATVTSAEESDERPETERWLLVTDGGDWRLLGVEYGPEHVVPEVSATFEYDAAAGTVTVTVTDGDALPAGELYLRGNGLSERSVPWHESAGEDVDPDTPVTPGDSAEVGVTGEEWVITLVWESETTSASVASAEGPGR